MIEASLITERFGGSNAKKYKLVIHLMNNASQITLWELCGGWEVMELVCPLTLFWGGLDLNLVHMAATFAPWNVATKWNLSNQEHFKDHWN